MSQSTEPLDGVRGLAAAMVFVSHLGLLGYYPWIRGFGRLGVLLFFVLSGFLMFALYAENLSSPKAWARFALRRVFRVYPLYVFVVLVSFVLFDVLSQRWALRMTREDLAGVLLLSEGLELLWTVPVEMKFYACFPVLAVVLARLPGERSRLFAIAVLLGAFLLFPVRAGRLSPWTFFEIFLCGVLAAQAFRAAKPRAWQSVRWNAVLVLAFGGVVLLLPSLTNRLVGVEIDPWRQSYVAVVPCVVLLVAATQSTGWAFALLTHRFMKFLGAISYSLYATHLPVLRLVDETFLLPPVWKIVSSVCLAVAVAWLCHRTVEAPFREIGRRLARAI